MNIGIILTWPKAEAEKDELVLVKSRERPWVSEILERYPEEHSEFLIENHDGKMCVAGDVSIGMYIAWNWKNVNIDYILPDEISSDRFRENDINFMIVYDLLESFHVDKRSAFTEFKEALQDSDNVYPPYEYQQFINNKCNYISHLAKRNDSVIPTICFTKEEYFRNGHSKTIKALKKAFDGWGSDKFISKPVMGQESIGFKRFDRFNAREIKDHMDERFEEYPGLIFQKYIEGFDESNPEVRMYFIGDQYKYSVITTNKTVSIPEDEKGTEFIPKKLELVRKAKATMNKLPAIKMAGKVMPRLLTRIDVACQEKYAKPWIVNEVEFVPSLYIEDVNIIPEIFMGDQMVAITKLFIDAKKKAH